MLTGVTANYSWTNWDGPDVLFGGGGADFLPKAGNGNISQVARWMKAGYGFVSNKTELAALPVDGKRALGLFSSSTMSTWLDRYV